jgi:hypothetical protein
MTRYLFIVVQAALWVVVLTRIRRPARAGRGTEESA